MDDCEFDVENFVDENGNCPMNEFIEELRKNGSYNEINKINHFIKLLKKFGYRLPGINEEQASLVENGLYELRPFPNRVLYFYSNDNKKYILLHAFKKKTNKTPPEEKVRAFNEIEIYKRKIKNEK